MSPLPVELMSSVEKGGEEAQTGGQDGEKCQSQRGWTETWTCPGWSGCPEEDLDDVVREDRKAAGVREEDQRTDGTETQ